MTCGTFALLCWREDRGRVRASAICRRFEAEGVTVRVGGTGWACLSRTPGHSLRDDVHIFGEWFEGGVAGAPSDARSTVTVDDKPSCAGWGRYVVVDGSRASPWVRSDPSGAWPLWILSAPGLTIVTDHVSPSLAGLAGLQTAMRSDALCAVLADAACATHLSMLLHVVPLTPGDALDMSSGATIPEWRPGHLARRTACCPAEELRAAIDLAASSMSHGRTLMQLSGGLDSAIVMSSLFASGSTPPALNFATGGAGGDERTYAREVASRCGATLREVVADGFPDYSRIPAAAQGASPCSFGLDEMFENAVDGFAMETGANAAMTGQGGDAVFFQPATALIAVDRARILGRGRDTWSAMLDDARRSRSSFWHQFFPAVADLWRPARVPGEDFAPHLLTGAARASLAATDRRHPWARGIEALPPGKRMQIAMLASCQIFHGRRATGRTQLLHPLLSQPVLEASLAIPTFRLASGEYDRGLARATFGDRLPAALLTRGSKGEASDHYSRAALSNIDFLRDYLLDGRLVGMGILDREAMSALLTRDGLFRSYDYSGIPMQVSCEAWARAWSEAAPASHG